MAGSIDWKCVACDGARGHDTTYVTIAGGTAIEWRTCSLCNGTGKRPEQTKPSKIDRDVEITDYISELETENSRLAAENARLVIDRDEAWRWVEFAVRQTPQWQSRIQALERRIAGQRSWLRHLEKLYLEGLGGYRIRINRAFRKAWARANSFRAEHHRVALENERLKREIEELRDHDCYS